MRQQEDRLAGLDVKICIVTFEADRFAKTYMQETGLPWPLLEDDDRKMYIAYGMERGSWWSIYGPASIWAYLKLLFRGRRLRLPHDDVHQLGGDVLIDPEGIVQLHYIGSGPADRPTIEALLEPVQN